ncbi:MAG: hypothetical protein JWM33_871 [Caulobacteraceae bacterium]|nr:hypothetical protein [Caulobacteraceae bacterium]
MSDPQATPSRTTDPRGEFPMDLPEYLFHLQLFSVRCRLATQETLIHPLDLNPARYGALSVLDAFQPCTMKELAEFSVTDRTTMTRIIDGLVEAGWVERLRGPGDRREVIVTLTPAGLAKVREAYAVVRQMNRDALAGVPEQDQRELIRLSQAVLANLAPDAAARERLLLFSRGTASP